VVRGINSALLFRNTWGKRRGGVLEIHLKNFTGRRGCRVRQGRENEDALFEGCLE